MNSLNNNHPGPIHNQLAICSTQFIVLPLFFFSKDSNVYAFRNQSIINFNKITLFIIFFQSQIFFFVPRIFAGSQIHLEI